jgi:hypothetical protein
MVIEHSPWLVTWFEDSDYVKIPIEEFDLGTVSFFKGYIKIFLNPTFRLILRLNYERRKADGLFPVVARRKLRKAFSLYLEACKK